MMTFDVGDTIRSWGVFKAATHSVTAGVPSATYALTDPTTITLLVVEPDGTRTSYTYAGAAVTKHSTGVFYKDVPLTLAGEYLLRWEGTGAAAATTEVVVRAMSTRTG